MSSPRTRPADVLGPPAARRAVLAAQGFGAARPSGPVTRRHLVRTLDRIRLLQLDSVNVAVRAHYMPLFSRLGRYQRALVDDAAWAHTARRPRLLVEYWAHEASLLPVADWPLLRSKAKREGWWRHYAVLVDNRPGLVDDVLAAVKELGPVGAGELETALGGPAERRPPGASWWERSEVKRICEYLFGIGALTTGTRRHFQRLYDLPERVLPPDVIATPTPPVEDAQRELLRVAARSCGVASERDLRDYFRLPVAEARARIGELVEAGELWPVEVEGWSVPAYLHPEARLPRSVSARALVGPFDSLVWERSRAERLFGFRYRIEIYVPKPKRVHGYYVLPFLLGDRLVARVDLKADRADGVLRVQAAHAEPHAPPETAAELRAELDSMAGWLGLGGVAIEPTGDLAPALGAAARDAAAA